MREATAETLDRRTPPKPRLPLGSSGIPDLASNVDRHLEGFGDWE